MAIPFLSRRSSQSPLQAQRILLLHDSGDPYAAKAFRNVQQALRYARLAVDAHDLAVSPALPALADYVSVVLCVERITLLEGAGCEALERFVRRGGGVACVYRGWSPALAGLFGIALNDDPKCDEAAAGLAFTDDTFPGMSGLESRATRSVVMCRTMSSPPLNVRSSPVLPTVVRLHGCDRWGRVA